MISLVLALRASSITSFAAFWLSVTLGTFTLVIASTPAWPALVASSLVVDFSIASFAVFAASVASLINWSFVVWSIFSALLISLVLSVNAWSISLAALVLASAKLGTVTLLMLAIPSVLAVLTVSVSVDWLIAVLASSAAFLASAINWSLVAWSILVASVISVVLVSKAFWISSVAAVLAFARLVSPFKPLIASVIAFAALSTCAWVALVFFKISWPAIIALLRASWFAWSALV